MPHDARPNRPLVSAVIPTRDRPDRLACAIRSALRQSWPNMEVVVVVDGPDPGTAALLDTIADPRLRVIFLPEWRGGCDARNAGVRAAIGDWIAFLDDDEWLPRKIECQMRAARAMRDWFPVVSCRLIAQSPRASRVLPLTAYQAPQPVADFLFCRRGLGDPGGVIQSSTLLAQRELLMAVPFESGLAMHQDWDWILRVTSYKGVGLSMVQQPLAIWRVEDARTTVGRGPDWRFSLSWIRRLRALVSPRAFSWFVAIQCVWRAQAGHATPIARLEILRAFLFEGAPELRSCLSFVIFALIPTRLRRFASRLARKVLRNGPDGDPGLRVVYTHHSSSPVLRKSSL